MIARRLAIALLAVLAMSGCSSEPEVDVLMPGVTGLQLDVAIAAIEDAGVSQEAVIEGGGTFGVVNESAWQVCAQTPSAGAAVTGAPGLTVARSCDEADPVASDEAEPVSSDEAALVPSDEAKPEQVLTVDNNADLAALMSTSADDATSAAFAAKYRGSTIAFDGYISALAPHGNYKTRFDLLIDPGDGFDSPVTGSPFKFEDVSIVYDLQLTGDNIPDNLAVGQKVRATVELGDWNQDLGFFYATPVSTEIRQ